MLNVEKIRLMTQLSIYEKKEGKGIIETSKYFKGDYISRGILTAAIYYTLCYILIAIVYCIINLEEILLKLNIPFIMSMLHTIVVIYLAGLVLMIFCAYIRYNHRYDSAHRKSLYYTAKLDKLLRMQETENGFLDITEDEAEYYRETGGKIRIYDDSKNTWQTIMPQFHTIVKSEADITSGSNKNNDLDFVPINNGRINSSSQSGYLKSHPDAYHGSYEPEGGWLDDPVPSGTRGDTSGKDISTPPGGWLDEDIYDDDGLDVLSIHKKDK
ncbi:hypothetical protein [Oribacterium sp. WCC10]|uniref:hypothetical protein n=1 Tax=Oribacterium sp. WCC10 TaxID=1855343 RepID=UPI0008E5377D|nr:hypothetical protein [Oribacterium sp. WCC10]SFG57325.1 hypothetical protein SAMN05216356_11377 [Oribacterium sp. WCC10]